MTGSASRHTSAIGHSDELISLAALSARIGVDPLLTQGAGGNTSVKIGNQLWVKASGLWLADALKQPIFACIDLPTVLGHIESLAATGVDTLPQAYAGMRLRPSIETSLHALMPHRVVVHVHTIDGLADLVQTEGEALAATRLAGLAWCWIPYCRPGTPLTLSVRASLSQRPVDVLMLANHGLVVAAETVAEAENLLNDVVQRLSRTTRAEIEGTALTPPADVLQAMADLGYQPCSHAFTHTLASDPVSCALLAKGVLYPDQAVFLGAAIPVADDATEARSTLETWAARYGSPPKVCVVKGAGAFVRVEAGAGVHEQLLGHALLLARLDSDSSIETLPADEVAGLLDWDAEKYRQMITSGA